MKELVNQLINAARQLDTDENVEFDILMENRALIAEMYRTMDKLKKNNKDNLAKWSDAPDGEKYFKKIEKLTAEYICEELGKIRQEGNTYPQFYVWEVSYKCEVMVRFTPNYRRKVNISLRKCISAILGEEYQPTTTDIGVYEDFLEKFESGKPLILPLIEHAKDKVLNFKYWDTEVKQ